MRAWSPERIAAAAGARLLAGARTGGGPERAVIDSRQAGPGTLFIGLHGEHLDGGEFAQDALRAGAWGVIVTPELAERAAGDDGVVLSAEDPLIALHRLATAWRRELGAKMIGVTGSTGIPTRRLACAPGSRTVAEARTKVGCAP